MRPSLRGGPPGIAILAWDPVAGAPVPREAGPGDEAGRSPGIVAGLSAACGYCPAALPGGEPSGKVAWVIITTP